MASSGLIMANVATGPEMEFRCDRNLNLYKTAACQDLVTQAAAGRQLKLEAASEDGQAVFVRLCEDDYPGWLPNHNRQYLWPADTVYESPTLSASEIQAHIPEVIAFTQTALNTPNVYRWGGTLAPDYDCSGLMQAAFASVGIWLPRDSYQQAAFVTPVPLDALIPGDLIFFGRPERVTHVGLHLGNGRYLHSSGKDQGRNGIGIDSLYDLSDPVSQRYYEQLHSHGRVTHSYCSEGVRR